LDEKEQELLNKLIEVEKYKKKGLELQIEELNFGIESIIGSCQMIENSISLPKNNKNDIQLTSMKKLYESRLNYLSNNIWRIEPCHNSFIDFLNFKKEEKSIYSSISNIGMIDSNEISVDKCLILKNEAQRVFKNEEFKFEIISYSKDGNEMINGGNGEKFGIKIKKELKLKDGNDEKYEWKIIDLNNGRYEVQKMKLKDEGKYLIFIEYDGMELLSSPFQIQVLSKLKPINYHEIDYPTSSLQSEGNKNEFNRPRGICVGLNGNIFVADSMNHRIQIFDPEENFISSFGSNGNKNGEFDFPCSLAINSKGNILVCDYEKDRIQIFDSEGKFISTFGSMGNENGQFNYPSGICVDKNDRIYVCDSWRIQVFDSEGEYIFQFKYLIQKEN